jgi:hypothetical protein
LPQELPELVGGYLWRRRAPAVALAQQHHEVGPRRNVEGLRDKGRENFRPLFP